VSGQAQVHLLPGGRLHLHHGPIDIVAQAFGHPENCMRAYRQAARRFQTILAELVDELPLLRQRIGAGSFEGAVARRMAAAVRPHGAKDFITPMAAVAGAVADEVLAAMIPAGLTKAYANNGGDIAWHLRPGQSLRAGIVANQDAPAIDGLATLHRDSPARGMATSGWRGRSCSLGIADAVTVLAADAAAADAAATLVANAVDGDHPAIRRAPACDLHDDTDLGSLPVTIAVGPLPDSLVREALARGAAVAEAMQARGLLHAANLVLQGHHRTIQPALTLFGRSPCLLEA
jgi:ApbE superfamily uncharacterized protein (UPF0280 family)